MTDANMKKSYKTLAIKIILSVLITALLFCCGFVALIIVALSGGLYFHQFMTVAAFVAVWLFAIAQIWKLLKPKTRYIAFVAAAALIMLPVAGFEIIRAYDNGIEQLSERNIDLSLYDPFRENTLAASLDAPPALTLSGELPRLDGATALYPVYSAFARAVYPREIFQPDALAEFVQPDAVAEDFKADGGAAIDEPAKPGPKEILACTNTGNAYRRLITGYTDIIFVAKPSKEQREMAAEAGVELTLTPIGREAFVFFVNAKNPVRGLAVDDIRRIYSGKAVNWREFGGKNKEIRAFQRPVNSGSQTALIGLMGETPLMSPPSEDVAGGMGDIINEVSAYRNYDNAIGYSFLFFATEMARDDKIKLLEINGVAPTRENVENGTYPYASEFYAVTAGTENPNAGRLIDWILSAQGQELIAKTGYTPLR